MNLRIAVGGPEGPRSTVWRIFSQGGEVYAAHRSLAGIEKFSFHSSRICRRAFVKERNLPDGKSDRLLERWIRAETPAAGQRRAVAVLSVIFPTAHLSSSGQPPNKSVLWVSPAGSDSSRVVQMIFTRDSESELQNALVEGGAELLAYQALPNGDGFAVTGITAPWEGKTLIVNPAQGGTEDIVLPCYATPSIDRPIRFTLFARPDEMRCFEYSGFKMPAGKAEVLFPDADRLMDRQIIGKGKFKK